MTFSRFSVEPIVVIGSDIYIIHIQSGSRSSVIHSCRKYWNRAAKVPVVPVSSSLTLVSISATGRKAVARSILIFLLVPSSVRYRVFSPSSSTFLCTAWQK
ncbi:hypothetical protein T01_418 [Trichinella spiralis]|uniref:Uncharacterized protein n=1 Tax=Trichinella spiralis TaxID=6334 RepID=A0A0V1AUJ2_TRISP|nr:hypothetical protein T01_418 [Trichinella spiralis]